MDLISVLGSIVIFSAISVFLFELFQKWVLNPIFRLIEELWKLDKVLKLNKTWTQVLTWLFSYIVVYIDATFVFGIFGGVTLFYTLLIGLLVGLAANGIWTFPPVQTILGKLNIKV